MSTLKDCPPSHQLLLEHRLPIGQLQAMITDGLDGMPSTQRGPIRDRIVDGILHQYFIDAEGRRLKALIEAYPLIQGLALEGNHWLFGLIQNTIGPLMPSYIYRYQLVDDCLQLNATLPTLTDYEERLSALADPDEGWVPPRYR